MRATITDPANEIILTNQLNKGGMNWIDLVPICDVQVQSHQLAVYSALLSDANDNVFSAWVVTVMGNSGVYNQDHYPTPEDAVAQHVGRLAIEGQLEVVEAGDGAEEIAENEPPPGFKTL